MIPKWISEISGLQHLFNKNSEREAELLVNVPVGVKAYVLECTKTPDYYGLLGKIPPYYKETAPEHIGHDSTVGRYLALITKVEDAKANGWIFENNGQAAKRVAKFLAKAAHT